MKTSSSVIPAITKIQKHKNWMPAFAGMTILFCVSATAADSLLPKKKGQPDFLPVDQAFELQPLEYSDGKLTVGWRIAKNYYLYRNRLKFTLTEPGGATLGTAAFPAAEKYEDEHFGTTEIYRERVKVQLPLAAPAGAVKLKVAYQGCADAGLCYPIQTRSLEVTR